MLNTIRFPALGLVLLLIITISMGYAVKVDLPKNTIILEAEDGKMDKGVKVLEVKGASGGKATDHERGAKTLHEIEIPEAGVWYLWIRIFCPNPNQDSYWLGMEGAEPHPAEDALGEQGIRIYSAAGDSVNTQAHPLNIWFWDFGKGHADPRSFFKVKKAGKHVFWSKGREPGTLLDQILLTMDENFNPEEASRGEPIEVPKAVDPQGKLALTWGNLKAF
jgi:hypothetical protein